MKISNLIFLSIIFILILFSFTTYINYRQSEEVRDNAEFLTSSTVVVRQSNQIQRNILYMERGLRGYLMTNENSFVQIYDSAFIENAALFKELSTSLLAQSTQLENLEKIRDLYQQWVEQFAGPLIAEQKSSDHPSTKRYFENGQLIRNETRINLGLQREFRELLNIEYTNRENRKAILEHSETKTKWISFSLTVLSIVVGMLIAFFLATYIGRRIHKMVAMANNIAKGNFEVQVSGIGRDELSTLARSLNHMAVMLAENIALLNRKNRELDQFAHIVSHDLKAPLQGINNVISWIEEDHIGEMPVKVNEYLELIKRRVNRLENLIQGILDYARVGKESQEKEVVDVGGLINEIWQSLSPKPGMHLTLQPGLPVIQSEKLPLVQIFTNLISNALNYHDKQEGEIKIYGSMEKDRYVFSVEDDGPGIGEPYHEKIFVIFQTLKARDSFESTGVGLAIVKKILDDRKEQISLVSEPGQGSIFSFTWTKIKYESN